jgi:2-C-methyl-D-erythritol 2,4-cyclodiphosphate synthase
MRLDNLQNLPMLPPMKIKIGTGYDIHRLVSGRKLILGGIEVPHGRGLLGHSDGDVLIHAIADAILGALGLHDIGEAFPDTAPWTEGMDSKKILEYSLKKVEEGRYAISNVDAVLIAEEPKLSAHILEIRSSIAAALNVEIANIGLKATTNEGLGPIGRGEAIAAIANVLIFAD